MSKEKLIAKLEREANREDISIPERLAKIHDVYAVRGIPKWVYAGE